MRVDFRNEMQQAAELHGRFRNWRAARIWLADLTMEEHGRQRLAVAYYGRTGVPRRFTTPDEIEAFDRLYASLVTTVSAVTMKVKGSLAELIPSVVQLEPHAARLELHDPREPEAKAISTVEQRWLGLRSARLTVIGCRSGVDCTLTAYARRRS